MFNKSENSEEPKPLLESDYGTCEECKGVFKKNSMSVVEVMSLNWWAVNTKTYLTYCLACKKPYSRIHDYGYGTKYYFKEFVVDEGGAPEGYVKAPEKKKNPHPLKNQ